LQNLGVTFEVEGDLSSALDCYRKSLRLKTKLGDLHGQGTALVGLGNLSYKDRKLEKALDYYQKSLIIRKKLGDRYGEGLTLANLGRMYLEQGKTRQAIKLWQQSLNVLKDLDAPEAAEVASWLKELEADNDK
jgi:tetratricopeptide (TPR) repeat protein